ncbi:MAG: hypothetical protein IJ192_12060 [Clostridia bacterium]|nr:hypothetical protein [Clostridia bacterium]
MKKTVILMIAALAACMSFAACKTNTTQEPANSNPNNGAESSVTASEISDNTNNDNIRQEEASNGVVTDDNGVIGDGDNDNSGNLVSDVVSDTGEIVSDVVSGAGDVVSDVVSGTESVANNAAEGLDGDNDNTTRDDNNVNDNTESSYESSVTNP